MYGHWPVEFVMGILPLAARSPANTLVEVVPLPTQTLLDQSLLLLRVSLEVLDERPGLLRGVFLHFGDLLLQVQPAGAILLAEQTQLYIVSDEQTLDFVLVELAASANCVIIEVVCLRLLQ
jgi:hypothetical protein